MQFKATHTTCAPFQSLDTIAPVLCVWIMNCDSYDYDDRMRRLVLPGWDKLLRYRIKWEIIWGEVRLGRKLGIDLPRFRHRVGDTGPATPSVKGAMNIIRGSQRTPINKLSFFEVLVFQNFISTTIKVDSTTRDEPFFYTKVISKNANANAFATLNPSQDGGCATADALWTTFLPLCALPCLLNHSIPQCPTILSCITYCSEKCSKVDPKMR